MTSFNHHHKTQFSFLPSTSVHGGWGKPDSLDRVREKGMRSLIDRGFPYSRTLTAHTSCVNALTFSKDGKWLASAGDDPFVQLWDFHQDEVTKPVCGFSGHRLNVFALEFSASNQFLYSGDTDDTIHKYDITRWSSHVETPGTPITTINRHKDSIRELSCHPEDDNLLMSAAEDGTIMLHDFRVGNGARPQGVMFGSSEFTGASYNPTMPNLFITGELKGHVRLRDVRMSFDRSNRRGGATVQTYATLLSKPGSLHLCSPEVGSLTFDRTGTKLAVTTLHHLPTIYALSDPFPLATCSGRYLPDGSPIPEGQRTYVNSCTIKHGSFGGPGPETDEYYTAGSDDFRAYVWKIPELAVLTEAREKVNTKDWNGSSNTDRIGFTLGKEGDRYVPVELSKPLCRLGGHKSIVNTSLMHPYWPHIVTAGIERHIILHGPTTSSPCTHDLSLTPDVRELPGSSIEDQRLLTRALIPGRDTLNNDDDRETIGMFDEILRIEGDVDIFEIRRWTSDSEDESSGSDVEAGEEDLSSDEEIVVDSSDDEELEL